MKNYHFKRRDFLKWALASGFSAYLLDKRNYWAQNSADTAIKQADLIAFNGRITTLNSQQAEASALAIKDGKFIGDFAVLSDNYFSVAEAEIKNIESVLTVVGGKYVYGTKEYESLNLSLPAVSPDWSPIAYYGGYYSA